MKARRFEENGVIMIKNNRGVNSGQQLDDADTQQLPLDEDKIALRRQENHSKLPQDAGVIDDCHVIAAAAQPIDNRCNPITGCRGYLPI